jgi:hypothetical protein
LQNGLPIATAQAAALAELGDARAAARRFRRTHLTVSELGKVAGLWEFHQPSLWVHVTGFGACFWLGFALDKQWFSVISVIGRVALLILYEAVAFVLSRRKSPRRVVQMEMGGWLMTAISLLCMFHSLRLHGWPAIFLLLVYLRALGNILYYFRLNNKLGKEAEVWMGETVAARTEFPPDQHIVS